MSSLIRASATLIVHRIEGNKQRLRLEFRPVFDCILFDWIAVHAFLKCAINSKIIV